MSTLPGWVIRPVSGRYGAPLGRLEYRPDDWRAAFKLHVRRVPLDKGGYDQGGAYWGLGDRLYVAYTNGEADAGETVRFFFRVKKLALAGSWAMDAQACVLRRYPNARFYR